MSRRIRWTLVAVLLLALPTLGAGATKLESYTAWDSFVHIVEPGQDFLRLSAISWGGPDSEYYQFDGEYKRCELYIRDTGMTYPYAGHPQTGLHFTGSGPVTCKGLVQANTLSFDVWLEPVLLYHGVSQEHLVRSKGQTSDAGKVWAVKGWFGSASGQATVCLDSACDTFTIGAGQGSYRVEERTGQVQ